MAYALVRVASKTGDHARVLRGEQQVRGLRTRACGHPKFIGVPVVPCRLRVPRKLRADAVRAPWLYDGIVNSQLGHQMNLVAPIYECVYQGGVVREAQS